MTTRSGEEALNEYILRFGEDRGKYVKAIENDLFELRILFEIYENLFGTNEERVALLNSASSQVSYYFEMCMFHELLLRICKLTDPVKSSGKSNVTIQGLCDRLTIRQNEELTLRVRRALEFSEFARDWRNKRLAHADEEVRLQKAAIQPPNIHKLKQAIDGIANCVKHWAFVELDVSLTTHPIRRLGDDEMKFLRIIFRGICSDERIRRDAEESRDWRAAQELERLPEWLTARREQAFDNE